MTPVGNVVILGVAVLSIDGVTDLETVVLEHLDPVGDGLEDWDRVRTAERVWLTEKRLVIVPFSLRVVVLEIRGVEEALVLPLKDVDPDAVLLVDMDAVGVLDRAEEVEGLEEAVSAVVMLEKEVRVGVAERTGVCVVLAVSV